MQEVCPERLYWWRYTITEKVRGPWTVSMVVAWPWDPWVKLPPVFWILNSDSHIFLLCTLLFLSSLRSAPCREKDPVRLFTSVLWLEVVPCMASTAESGHLPGLQHLCGSQMPPATAVWGLPPSRQRCPDFSQEMENKWSSSYSSPWLKNHHFVCLSLCSSKIVARSLY